ncbi:DUF2269 domain-containing protein [Nocardioides sp. HDW12B]|uniref:DUF2269 domain-containing protein n=1 Tax=Nocardioides sp. HDW12B TaxID=2714939 RepID=UPI0019803FF8|nr:DUF2269 domain-containing protein [Nocardioides sp. HDW12B]
MTGEDTVLLRAAYVAMDWAAWGVLVPLAAATLVTGVAQSLVTKWGLLRHYWVIFKLAVTVLATGVLVTYTSTLDAFADVATLETITPDELQFLRSASVVVHATGALILLVSATALAVYKPAGLTRRGYRHRQRARTPAARA